MNRFLSILYPLLLLCGCSCGRTTYSDSESAKPSLPDDFLRGMTFAHEGYRGHNGYGGNTVGPSLDSLQRMHVNAVSIVPYTFMRETDRLEELPVPDHYGAENDGAVRNCIRQAHERGLFVLLKPQIWVRGAWPGEIDFNTASDWDHFFNAYTEWMLHYAAMCQEEEIEALCIGTELVNTTLKHPDKWKEMIDTIRTVYDGKLTYAANWGREFENITFWSELDAIGLNGYYPLSSEARPTDAELVRGARSWMGMADSVSLAYDRPLWLTEIGYRSVEGAWMNPHAEAGERPVSLNAQYRCYDALAAAAVRSTRLRGMFIWKWPSYLGHNEGRDGRNIGFVPGGKPAGAVLSRLYADPVISPGS